MKSGNEVCWTAAISLLVKSAWDSGQPRIQRGIVFLPAAETEIGTPRSPAAAHLQILFCEFAQLSGRCRASMESCGLKFSRKGRRFRKLIVVRPSQCFHYRAQHGRTII